MNLDSRSRIANLARDFPATIRIFQSHGIDFCCGGKLPLEEACESRGVPAAVVRHPPRPGSTSTSAPSPATSPAE
jgi:iron-sulfur cluster repair protein YtfE (RIC family)